MRDAPEEEEDTHGRKQCRHDVHAVGHLGGVVGELREQVARQHEERCSGGMPHFELEGRGDELGTVPKACGRLNGAAIRKGSHEEGEPAGKVVYKLKSLHYFE